MILKTLLTLDEETNVMTCEGWLGDRKIDVRTLQGDPCSAVRILMAEISGVVAEYGVTVEEVK